jgi:hypothetical protein
MNLPCFPRRLWRAWRYWSVLGYSWRTSWRKARGSLS